MTFAEPPFKPMGRDAESMDVTTIELAGADATAPTEEGRLSGGASNEAQGPPGAALSFDETMTGLTLDEVSVVLVGDRPLLVPLSAGLVQRSGFTVIEVSDDSLLSLGVLPRRKHVEVVELVEADAARPPLGPTAAVSVAGASPIAPDGGVSTTATGAWVTWPTAGAGADSASLPGWPASAPRTPDDGSRRRR